MKVDQRTVIRKMPSLSRADRANEIANGALAQRRLPAKHVKPATSLAASLQIASSASKDIQALKLDVRDMGVTFITNAFTSRYTTTAWLGLI